MTEKQALAIADRLVKQWWEREEDGIAADEALKRILAETFIVATDRAASLGSLATMNELIWAARQAYDPGGPETLHIRAVEQGHIASSLLQTLKEIDRFYLLVVTSLNEVLPQVEDENIVEHLTTLRDAVMLSDEGVREIVDQYEE